MERKKVLTHFREKRKKNLVQIKIKFTNDFLNEKCILIVK